MNCETVCGKLPELLAGALDRDEELDVLTHLASCAGCRGELAFWAQMQQAVLEDAEDAPGGIIEDVREKLFGPRQAMVLETIKMTGRALGLAESACRLALAAVGVR